MSIPMTDDELDAYAMELAKQAGARIGDIPTAAAVLHQAGIALMIAFFPPDQIAEALSLMHTATVEEITSIIGAGQTKQ